jgi:Ca-activated chloride channel family protein
MDCRIPVEQTSNNFRFSAAVAEFGLLLRKSAFQQQASYDEVINLARSAKGKDVNGYRSEFIQLVQAATSLASN